MKQKLRKTPTNRRNNYRYYNAKGELVITLSPDAVTGVTDIHIKLLHSLDDAEVYNNRKNCGSGSVADKTADMEVRLDFRKSSRWVLSLNQLTDEEDMDYKENTKLLEQAYLHREEERRDVRKEPLDEAVGYLEPDQQMLFRMYYRDEMTQPEIAKILGITAPAVQKRRKKLVAQLKEIIFKKIMPDG